MASKSWTVTYALARMQNAMETAVGHFTGSASSSYGTALLAGLEALRTKELTTVVCMTGTAMMPTLNRLHEKEGVVDRLLMRCLPSHTGKRIYRGDIVAFKPPPGTEGSLLVRRVAAVEGDEMISDHPEDQAFRLPSGHCWVLADNEDMQVADAWDSRTFGPLPTDNVLGRILYYVRSRTEHGRVDSDALPTDTAIIEAELDVEKIAQTPC